MSDKLSSQSVKEVRVCCHGDEVPVFEHEKRLYTLSDSMEVVGLG